MILQLKGHARANLRGRIFGGAVRETIVHTPDTADYWHLRGTASASGIIAAFWRLPKVNSVTRPAFHTIRDALLLISCTRSASICGSMRDTNLGIWRQSRLDKSRSIVAQLCVIGPPAGVDLDRIITDTEHHDLNEGFSYEEKLSAYSALP